MGALNRARVEFVAMDEMERTPPIISCSSERLELERLVAGPGSGACGIPRLHIQPCGFIDDRRRWRRGHRASSLTWKNPWDTCDGRKSRYAHHRRHVSLDGDSSGLLRGVRLAL